MEERQTLLTEKGLNSDILKLIAIAAMFCDHFSVVFFGENMTALRWIGRIAFPLFAFFIAVGADKTRSVPKYLLRLLIFAFISEVPFDLAFSGSVFSFEMQNVFFTLAGGLFSIWCFKLLYEKKPALAFLSVIPLIAACVLTELLNTDYSAAGVLCIFLFYLFIHCENRVLFVFGVFVAVFAVSLNFWVIHKYSFALFLKFPVNKYELGALAAVPLILLYSGKRGVRRRWAKYFFYAFYPLHIFLLWAASKLISG